MLELPFTLHPGADAPLYEQLYAHLAGLIRTGGLAAGSRLPGKRSLADSLGVSVNTVDTAYQILTAEGYLESRPRSGFFVLPGGWLEAAPSLPETPAAALDKTKAPQANPAPADAPAVAPEKAAPNAAPEKAETSAPEVIAPACPLPGMPGGRGEADFASNTPPPRFDLSTSGVDTRLFPFRTWGRIQKELLYSAPELLGHGDRQGDENLRAAIAQHLRSYRGVRCGPEQIVVGAGLEYLLGLLARLLAGSTAAVENPGYLRTRTVLQNNGIPCRLLDIDGGGLPVDALAASGAQLAYVTPSHQFPTGVTMPAGRRAELLAWARGGPGRYILEDDYDSEFRYDIRPLPSLQGMAGPDGPVVYLTTFSKSLAPSIRVACMVLPHPLLRLYQQMYGVYSSTVSRFEQQTLCRFMEAGHFARHLARLRKAYRGRMELLASALEDAFGPGRLVLQGRHSGLHLLLTLQGGRQAAGVRPPAAPALSRPMAGPRETGRSAKPNDGPFLLTEAEMLQAAGAAGVRLAGLSSYYMARPERCPARTVVMGYAGLPPEEIPLLAETLAAAWKGRR